MLIHGEKTSLRPVDANDQELMMHWENNPEFWEVSEHDGPLSVDMIRDFIRNSEDLKLNGQLRLIIQNEAQEAIGALDLFDYDGYLKSAGLGILIAEKTNRNRGYAKDALKAVLEYQKAKREILLIRSLIHTNNAASISLFTAAGFKKTGIKYFKGKEAVQFIYEL